MASDGRIIIQWIFTSYWIGFIDFHVAAMIAAPTRTWINVTAIDHIDDSSNTGPTAGTYLYNSTETRIETFSHVRIGNSQRLPNSRTDREERNATFPFDVCHNFSIPLEKYKSKCCQYQYNTYAQDWNAGSYYLVEMLEVMQRWDCKEFEAECEKRTWSFTEYSRRIYDLFCRRSDLERQCYQEIVSAAIKYNFQKESAFNKSWTFVIESLDSSVMEMNDLAQPCIQAALFDRKDVGVGRFHEIMEHSVPFCGLQWEGYDYNTTVFRGVSIWIGLSAG